MVQIWSALASQDTRLFCAAMNRFPAKPPTTVWGTYLRCHDDIGWAIDDADAASVGLNGYEHRRFLADFYAGSYPMSDARGLVFQENLATGDRRISGTAASLAGIEAALYSGDEAHLDLAIRRLLLAYQIVLGFGGLPLIYMGDELGLRNYYDFADDPEHADDNRWVHRPPMPWALADRRHDPNTLEHRVWHGLRHAIAVRASLPSMDASVETEVLDPVNPAVLVFVRRFPTQTMVGVYNVTPEPQTLPRWVIAARQLGHRRAERGQPAHRRRPDPGGLPGPLVGAGGLSPVSDAARTAIEVIRDALASLEVDLEESRPGLFSVTLPGTHKLRPSVRWRSASTRWRCGRSWPGGRTRTRRRCTAGCWSATCARTGSPSALDALGDIYLTGGWRWPAYGGRDRSLAGVGGRDRRRLLQRDPGTRLRRQHPAGVGLAPFPRRVDGQPGRLPPPGPRLRPRGRRPESAPG